MFNLNALSSLLLVGGLVGAFWAVGLALFRFSRRRNGADLESPANFGDARLAGRTRPPLFDPRRAGTFEPARPGRLHPDQRGAPVLTHPVGCIAAALHDWLFECTALPDLWAAFDQLVRETLAEHLPAARVRCYRVAPESDVLQTISQGSHTGVASAPSLRDGLLGHVATAGKEFVRPQSFETQNSSLNTLADGDGDQWSWVWPVRAPSGTLGVVAVANVPDPAVLTPELRQTVGTLLSLCWQHVACLERLRVVQRTDQGSGVLTRSDFFTLAGHALADSYHANEPAVLAVFALEGLRGLDDAGQWEQRDRLVVQIGQAISLRTRSDDLVGRFTDDRFVVLLRRLDSALGRIIAQKMLAAASDCLRAGEPSPAGEAPSPADRSPPRVRIRAGLAGSGFAHPSLAELLTTAIEAVEHARRENVPLQTDLRAAVAPQRPVAEEHPGAETRGEPT